MDNKGLVIIYNNDINETKVEVKLIDNNVWMTQDQIALLYQSSKSNISEHIKHILEEKELDEFSTVRKFRTVQNEGTREVKRNVNHYNLDMIIAIGYRVRSNIGTNFRRWATNTLHEYMVKGFALNDNILKEAGGGRYFKELLQRIRDIRSSEKVFWCQVLDIFATSSDYDPTSSVSIEFFKTVQNKMHWAAHGHTAAEIIKERADAKKDFMGLTSFNGDYPLVEDAVIAKATYEEIRNRMDEEDTRIAQAFEEKELLGDPVKQIAKDLGVSEPRVYQLISRAKAIGREYRKKKLDILQDR